ncbi:MAG: metal ABC transporter substrate-binding protein [Gemmatimonadales bacterium]|jgi:zinc/manganese transport system substrate-binding protein|nr:metal ABC transporter substrate-binding protein [Gemmatimonadales bacterium]
MRHGLSIATAVLFCAAPAHAKVRVVTSIETLAAITRSVGGDRVTVQAVGSGSQDPHLIAPKAGLAATLAQAHLVVHVGLDLEAAWLPRLIEQSRNPRIRSGAPGNLDCSRVIAVVDRPQASTAARVRDQHPHGNPHYWIPPGNALRVAQLVAERLRALDPAGARTYRAGLQRFRDEVTRRQPQWLARTAPLKGRKIVTYHRGWTYVAAWLGLVEVAHVEPAPGVTPTLRQLADLAVFMKREGIRTIIVAPYQVGSTARLAARLADARLVVVPDDVNGSPPARDYVRLVDEVIEALRSLTVGIGPAATPGSPPARAARSPLG